jgi:hypothetical protein
MDEFGRLFSLVAVAYVPLVAQSVEVLAELRIAAPVQLGEKTM